MPSQPSQSGKTRVTGRPPSTAAGICKTQHPAWCAGRPTAKKRPEEPRQRPRCKFRSRNRECTTRTIVAVARRPYTRDALHNSRHARSNPKRDDLHANTVQRAPEAHASGLVGRGCGLVRTPEGGVALRTIRSVAKPGRASARPWILRRCAPSGKPPPRTARVMQSIPSPTKTSLAREEKDK